MITILAHSLNPMLDAEIDALGQLPRGWRFGEGGPISEAVRQRAKVAATYAAFFGLDVSAFPSVGGEVILRYYKGEHTLEVYVNEDETFDVALEKGRGFDFEVLFDREGVGFDKLKELLTSLAWNTSASYTPVILTFAIAGSSAVFSSELPGKESLSFRAGARKIYPGQSANTSGFTIVN